VSINFEKSLEAKEGMREVLDAAEAFAPVAAPIATAARVVGNVAAAVITPVVNNVCGFNRDTRAFCEGLAKPFKDVAERMASVPDPLRTDYGFSRDEARRFEEATGDVFTAAAAAMPFIKSTPIRVSHQAKYGTMNDSFVGAPKEYWGTLKRDLILVRFGKEMDAGFKTTVWWTNPAEINPITTLGEVEEYAAILSRWGGKRTHVTVAKIPAGEPIRFLHGRAAPQTVFDPFEFKVGGMVQYQFYDFDPKWIRGTKPLVQPASGLFWTRRMIVAPVLGDEGDLSEEVKEISPESYFRHACVDVRSGSLSLALHVAGDQITEALNRISQEEAALREFQTEVAELCAYFRAEREGEARARDRAAIQGAMSDAAVAALAFGCPRLGVLFQAGHQMMRLEGAVEQVRGIKDSASMDGAIAIGSLAGAGASMVSVFARLDNSPSDMFGPLMEQMGQYSAILCGQVQEICRQVASFHAETMWEFGRARNELFTMYEELKAIQLQVTKETEFLKQDVTIGFLRVQRELDLFARETKYQMQELRLEELRKVEDGINHYEFGAVPLDKVRSWAATLERWMSNSPFKSAAKIRSLAEVAKAKKIIEIEDSEMEVLINLDTLEALLPAYTAVLKILREAWAVYDPEGKLWQKMVLDPIKACEVVSDKLEEKRVLIEETFVENAEMLGSFREHFTSYKTQITRIRRSVEEKKAEIKEMSCVMRTAEKFGEAAAKLDASEGLLADKLQALIAALAARK